MAENGPVGNNLQNISLSQLDMALTRGPFSIKSSTTLRLNLNLGDLVLAKFLEQDKDQLLLFQMGDEVVKASGELQGLQKGDFIIFKVIALGPPLKLKPTNLNVEDIHQNQLYTRLRAALLGTNYDNQEIASQINEILPGKINFNGLINHKTTPSDIALMFIIKEALADLFKGKDPNLGPIRKIPEGEQWPDASSIFRITKGILALEHSLQKTHGDLNIFMAPIFFENGEGKGLLAIYRQKEEEKAQKGEPRRGGISIELELYMSKIGLLRIFAGMRVKKVDIILRVRRSYKDFFNRGIQGLRDRLNRYGFSCRIQVYNLQNSMEDASILNRFSEQGLFHRLSNERVHLIV